MTKLYARDTPEFKALFNKVAKSKGLTESEFLRQVMRAAVADSAEDTVVELAPDNAVTARVTVRMPQFLLDGVKARGQTRGMSVSRWIASLVQSNLTRHTVMNDDEILALRISNRELAAIGRNINQIARALHDTLQNSERLPLNKLTELGRVIDKNRIAIRALIRTSQNVWEVE